MHCDAPGEWEGTSTTFTPDGTPEQLPEHYVPQAFRDWAVELFDWQTQCSSLATDTSFQVTARKLMPIVGCEADAVAFNEDGLKLWDAEEGPALLPVLPSGSYSHGEQHSRGHVCRMALQRAQLRRAPACSLLLPRPAYLPSLLLQQPAALLPHMRARSVLAHSSCMHACMHACM
jgi:hypothetical protein